MMTPAPGMPHSGNANSLASYSVDNTMISSSNASSVAPTSMGSLRPDTLASMEYNASFDAFDGPVVNGYQHMPSNIAFGAGVSNVVSSMGLQREPSQMIPTPGLNNMHPVAINADCSSGSGIFSTTSALVPQEQQVKQYGGSQNSHMLQNPGELIAARMRSNMQQKASYGLANGVMNGGLGSYGNNLHFVGGSMTSDGYSGTTAFGNSEKPMQHPDQQHHQLAVPNNEDMYDLASSVASPMSGHNMNRANMLSRPKNNSGLPNKYARLQEVQQIPRMVSQMSNHLHNMNFQPAQPSREHMMRTPHQMQNFQQQKPQHSIQSYTQFFQQQQQQSMQHQQLGTTSVMSRPASMNSDLGGELISDNSIQSQSDLLIQHSEEQINLSELQCRPLERTSSEYLKGTHLLGHTSGLQELYPPVQHSHLSNNLPNNNSSVTNGSQTNQLLQGYWQQQNSLSFSQQSQDEFHERVKIKEVQQHCLPSEGCLLPNSAATQSLNGLSSGPRNAKQEQDYLKQMRWLLLLIHARSCPYGKGACPEIYCCIVQELWAHVMGCQTSKCNYPRCVNTKKVYHHYKTCRSTTCPVCMPVRERIKREAQNRALSNAGASNSRNGLVTTNGAVNTDKVFNGVASFDDSHNDLQASSKRIKLQHSLASFVPKTEPSQVHTEGLKQPHFSMENQQQPMERPNIAAPAKSEVVEVKLDSSTCLSRGAPVANADKIQDSSGNVHAAQPFIETKNEAEVHRKQETLLVEKEAVQPKLETKQEESTTQTDLAAGNKSGKPKIKGVSLTELFTPEQVRDHIRGLRQWIGQSKAKAEKNQAMERAMNENSCQLCAVEKLTFDPPPIYCSPCGARIKRNAMYYTIGSGDTRHYFCIPCYNEARGDTIEVDGSSYQKARLEKKKNDEETEEWWVQCDKCEAWQHQICTLFNGRRNDGGQAEYTCPNCYIKEVERGERVPLPQSAVLGAKDLPRTILSDHIEERLFIRLKKEREDRAKHFGKAVDEVPNADGLVVRVVSSVDKKLEVKQRFLEIFQEQNYPTEFPYKSKVVLLFQKIEGVEVCLFGMYVQEFGSECQFPNQRRVYLSYLDSVKYFRPEIKAVTGEALRTFVYHEILIGYLDYCKKRGFTSCYIWACPPLKGEDYILYCHPEIQKTPKSDKLREWYLAMLRKAANENIVADLTNLYDHFFVSMGECKAKVTAARLPYFDGDYWPGAAEDMINQLQLEEDGKNKLKKGKIKKIITKRALKAAGHTDLSGNASKDALLMQKLGETIYPMKEDFIMVHLQHACTHCCILMVSGTRWVCKQCKKFQLCDRCYGSEQRLEERERHPVNSRDKHAFSPVEITDVPADTKDKDEILESEFFDTRQAFLSLCQGNHYQYDTLRRAKHSSMMVLYHLHNPTAPAFVTNCNVCRNDVETGQGWRCEICPDYDVCNACYQKNGGADHPHKLTNHPSTADRDAQNKEARQQRVLQLRKMLDLLVHASQCRVPHCQYPNCRKVKGLFRHGIQCKTRASGGCLLCKKMWYLLQLHARACKNPGCFVPRCKDLREHLKRMQQQSESRRRAAVMEMMRQRAAEVAGNTE